MSIHEKNQPYIHELSALLRFQDFAGTLNLIHIISQSKLKHNQHFSNIYHAQQESRSMPVKEGISSSNGAK